MSFSGFTHMLLQQMNCGMHLFGSQVPPEVLAEVVDDDTLADPPVPLVPDDVAWPAVPFELVGCAPPAPVAPPVLVPVAEPAETPPLHADAITTPAVPSMTMTGMP
jgi:hypothetical protein